MGNGMTPHHLKNTGGERWGGEDTNTPSSLPHHLTPKRGVGSGEGVRCIEGRLAGGEAFHRGTFAASPYQNFAAAFL